jgi:hypothetical protein
LNGRSAMGCLLVRWGVWVETWPGLGGVARWGASTLGADLQRMSQFACGIRSGASPQAPQNLLRSLIGFNRLRCQNGPQSFRDPAIVRKTVRQKASQLRMATIMLGDQIVMNDPAPQH